MPALSAINELLGTPTPAWVGFVLTNDVFKNITKPNAPEAGREEKIKWEWWRGASRTAV